MVHHTPFAPDTQPKPVLLIFNTAHSFDTRLKSVLQLFWVNCSFSRPLVRLWIMVRQTSGGRYSCNPMVKSTCRLWFVIIRFASQKWSIIVVSLDILNLDNLIHCSVRCLKQKWNEASSRKKTTNPKFFLVCASFFVLAACRSGVIRKTNMEENWFRQNAVTGRRRSHKDAGISLIVNFFSAPFAAWICIPKQLTDWNDVHYLIILALSWMLIRWPICYLAAQRVISNRRRFKNESRQLHVYSFNSTVFDLYINVGIGIFEEENWFDTGETRETQEGSHRRAAFQKTNRSLSLPMAALLPMINNDNIIFTKSTENQR